MCVKKHFFIQITIFAALTLVNIAFLHYNYLHAQTKPFERSLFTSGQDEKEANKQPEVLFRANPTYQQLSPDLINRKWLEVDAFHKWSSFRQGDLPWTLVGLAGAKSSQDKQFVCSGRVRELEVLSDNTLRVGSASGGLWELKKDANDSIIKTLLNTNQINSIWLGSFASNPVDENIILLGTGEPDLGVGAGLWRTTDRGVTWKNIVSLNSNKYFYKIEYAHKGSRVWCVGDNGAFSSENDGLNWTKKRPGKISGLVINYQNSDSVIIGHYGVGIFRSLNNGQNWKRLDGTNGLPVNNLGRISLANSPANPNIVFASIVNRNHFTEGIYKSIDFGENWIKCPILDANGDPATDIHWGLGWYCNMVEVSPVNPNHVIVGGGWWAYSKDGYNFYGPPDNVHPDMHSAAWTNDGSKFFLGNDGGVFQSTFIEEKIEWDFNYNYLPITQIHNLSVSKKNPEVIITGGQDNGVIFYDPQSKDWYYVLGDGGGVSTDPNDEFSMYCTLGIYGGDLTFRNLKKSKGDPNSWSDINVNIEASDQWWRQIRCDDSNPSILYSQAHNSIYTSTTQGATWTKMNNTHFPFEAIWWLMPSRGKDPSLYAGSGSVAFGSLWVLEPGANVWNDISNGLPNVPYVSFPIVYPSANSSTPDHIYAVIRGEHTSNVGKKIFKSMDRGFNWNNITGNLPNVPFTTVLEHPYNPMDIVAGTEGFGIFRTLDGGKNWFSWFEGIPKTALIRDVDYQHFTGTNDSVFIVLATYGSSVWGRYWHSEPVTRNSGSDKADIKFLKYANGFIILDTDTKLSGKAHLTIYNSLGELIQSISLQIDSFSSQIKVPVQLSMSGIYYARLQMETSHSVPLKFFIN
jgi:photosystem II stability/assembly factor-like uncharacterized protein